MGRPRRLSPPGPLCEPRTLEFAVYHLAPRTCPLRGSLVHPTQTRLEVDVVLDPGVELLLLGGTSAGNERFRVLPFRHDNRVLGPDLDTLAGHFVPPSLP